MKLWQKLFGSGAKPQTLFGGGPVPLPNSTQSSAARPVAPQSKPSVLSMPDALRAAAVAGKLEELEVLVRNNPELVFSRGSSGATLLHLAASGGHKGMVDFLLAKNAEVNATTNCRDTPLHLAAHKGHTAVARLLLAANADVNATNDMRDTPLHNAAAEGHAAIAELLLAYNADITAKAGLDLTPSQYAMYKHHTQVAELLSPRDQGRRQDAASHEYQRVLDRAGPSPKYRRIDVPNDALVQTAREFMRKGYSVQQKRFNGIVLVKKGEIVEIVPEFSMSWSDSEFNDL